jgi:hypothetical protein
LIHWERMQSISDIVGILFLSALKGLFLAWFVFALLLFWEDKKPLLKGTPSEKSAFYVRVLYSVWAVVTVGFVLLGLNHRHFPLD